MVRKKFVHCRNCGNFINKNGTPCITGVKDTGEFIWGCCCCKECAQFLLLKYFYAEPQLLAKTMKLAMMSPPEPVVRRKKAA